MTFKDIFTRIPSTPVKSAVAMNFVIRVLFMVLGFANSMLLARFMGPDGLGVYAFVIALLGFLAIPVQFGLPTLVTRSIAASRENHEWGSVKGLIRVSQVAVVIMSLLIMMVVAVCLNVWPSMLSDERREVFLLGLFYLPMIGLIVLQTGVLRGFRRVTLALVPESLVRPLFILLAVAGAGWLLGNGEIVPSVAMQIYLASATVALVFAWAGMRMTVSRQMPKVEARYDTVRWLKESVPLGLGAATHTMKANIALIALGILATDSDVGVYRIAIQFAALVGFALQVFNTVLGPYFSQAYAAGDMQRLEFLVGKSTLVMTALSLPIVGILLVAGGPLVTTLMGDAFGPAYLPLVLIALGEMFSVAMGSVGLLLHMTGHSGDVLRASLIGLLVAIAGCIVLIPFYGTPGAGLATAASLIVHNAIMLRQVRQRLGIRAGFISALSRLRQA